MKAVLSFAVWCDGVCPGAKSQLAARRAGLYEGCSEKTSGRECLYFSYDVWILSGQPSCLAERSFTETVKTIEVGFRVWVGFPHVTDRE